jgi:hypothetical protein
MATMGRPTQPTELKALKGTLRPGRLPNGALLSEISNSGGLPEPLGALGAVGDSFWRLAWSSPWLSHKTDYWLVLITAQNLDRRESMRALAEVSLDDRKLASSLVEIERVILSNLALMGFTPSDRARLGLSEVKKESKLEDLLRRKAERQEALRKSEH